MKKILLLTVAMLMASSQADAQFGNLVNNAKNATKSAVTESAKSKATAAKQEVEQRATTAATTAVETATTKPSAAAVAADPAASITEVQKDYTKSPAAIRAYWENQLDKELFPYQPYYNPAYQVLYQADSAFMYLRYKEVVNFIVERWGTTDDKGFNEFIKLDNGQTIFQTDAMMNAYAAAFIADPTSWKGYNAYIRFRVMFENRRFNHWQPSSTDKSDRKHVQEDGTTYELLENRTENFARWSKLNQKLTEMAWTQVPFNTIGSACVGRMNMLKAAKKEGKLGEETQYYLELEQIMADVEGSKLNPHDEPAMSLSKAWESMQGEGLKTLYDAHFAASPAVDMPAAVSVDASLQNEANAQGKKRWGDNFVKAVFRTNSWETFKNPNWPYEVRHRSMKVDYIVKSGDIYLVHHWVLKQFCADGKFTNYGIMADTVNPITQKVNYK